ncbi:MAG: prefoldin subunit alpha [Candidatus Wukongarchaeota archaeon]|nr:prefoldin subunit alpha [Candidatus Wukongarchaeota archaeon]MDO8128965.1 prefoldin subunit alpha [Candidatus Wukongarchaeota archaeon]
MSKEEELRQLMTQISAVEYQISFLQQQFGSLTERIAELRVSLSTLNSIQKAKDEDILLPVGGSVYAFGKLMDNSRVIIGLGANIFAEKGIDEAIKDINERQLEMERLQKQMRQQLEQLQENLTALRIKAQNLANQLRQQGGGM